MGAAAEELVAVGDVAEDIEAVGAQQALQQIESRSVCLIVIGVYFKILLMTNR